MNQSYELRVGDKVKVMRQIGKLGIPTEVTGVIERFMNIVTIGGEKTASIKYDDGEGSYCHALSKITPISNL
jgi:hypothetical protein